MGILESEVQQRIQMDAPAYGCILMRNNSGAFKDATGRSVRYGLGNISAKQNAHMKSSDLVGITQVVVTQEMVGKTIGVFTAIECKAEGKLPARVLDGRELAQHNFIEWVKAHGGIAGFASSIDDFKRLMPE